MNRAEFISLLRDPKEIKMPKQKELEKIVDDNPYFLSARILLAKGSKENKLESTKERIASAAVYSTDRILLKKYLNDELSLLSKPLSDTQDHAEDVAEQSVAEKIKSKESNGADSPVVIPDIPSGHLDEILDELKQDMENLRASRHHFAEVQQKIEEEDAVSAALERARTKKKKPRNTPKKG